MQILSYVIGLGSLICFIMVLIKQFQQKGALHGILGILSCGIYTFVWGWIQAAALGIKNIMIIWTVCFIGSIIMNILVMQAALTTTPVLP